MYKIFASDKSWIEGDAVRQLERTAQFPGMKYVAGMPDLHPGKGTPVGAAFLADDVIYPAIVGSDIGCGMSLWQTDISTSKMRQNKLEKLAKKLTGLDDSYDGIEGFLDEHGYDPSFLNDSLGTIGFSNHFAEFQVTAEVVDEAEFARLGLERDRMTLLAHSGSRGLGEAILFKYAAKYGAKGIPFPEANEYLVEHDHAVEWAKINRHLIAHRFLECLDAEGNKVIDLCHNSVVKTDEGWLHRKGAAPSNNGPVIIPGSRGTASYLVKPVGDQTANAWSVAHGAGRKWSRADCKGKLENRYSAEDMRKSPYGGCIICESKDLLFEEAPQAYKQIEQVIEDLSGIVEVIAIFHPVISYKTRKK